MITTVEPPEPVFDDLVVKLKPKSEETAIAMKGKLARPLYIKLIIKKENKRTVSDLLSVLRQKWR